MIRPFTAVCVLLAAGSGLYLYTEKHRTTLLDQQISQIIQHTQQVREHTAMLRAEWALLNQPDRLQSLAGRFLPGLHPMAPAQFVQMASLAQHLPEIAAPVASAAPAPEMTLALPPQQVMARSLTRAVPAPDELAVEPAAEPPAADVAQPRPQRVRALPHPVQLASIAATPRHPTVRMQPSSRPMSPVASGPAQVRPMVPRSTPAGRVASYPAGRMASYPAGRMASYEGAAVRNLLGSGWSSAGAYPHPTPIASWHPLRPVAALSAPAEGGPAGGHSSLGFSHAALSAPVPVQDGE